MTCVLAERLEARDMGTVMVAAGAMHTVALRGGGGAIWTWGFASSGCLGHGEDQDSIENLTQIDSEAFVAVRLVMVAVGAGHTVAGDCHIPHI